MLDAAVAVTTPVTTIFRARSIALDYLRTCIVLLVILHHSNEAYAVFGHFDVSHYLSSSAPILDTHRWIVADLLWQFDEPFFMSLMFLLSGLFVWRSLLRRGSAGFLRERALRLGVPYVVGLLVLMPPAYYPSFRMGGGAPGFLAYWWHTIVAGPRPTGPLWFLGVLLMFDATAAAMHRIRPDWSRAPAEWVERHTARPKTVFAVLLGLSIAAYVPLLLRFGPGRWIVVGTVLIQVSQILLYAVHFGTGIVIGRAERPLLSGSGAIARGWRTWLAAAVVSYLLVLLWKGVQLRGGAGLSRLEAGVWGGSIFALACCAIGFAWLAMFLQFTRRRIGVLDHLTANAYGIYLVHYLPLIWLQSALLPAGLPAPVKAALVFAGTLGTSWAAIAAARRISVVRTIL